MTRPLVVVGAGGFGRESLDVIEAVNAASPTQAFELLGVLDDDPAQVNLDRLEARGIKHLGGVAEWLSAAHPAWYVVAVGSPMVRRRLAEQFDAHGDVAATLVHPSAVLGSVTDIASGAVLCAGVQVSTNVRLGKHVHLNPSATVGHDSVLEDFVAVNPGAIISGDCRIGRGALVGASAVILQGLSVGAGAVVGAAACVVRDVPAGLTVKGVPAR